jgi:hypothetical protein
VANELLDLDKAVLLLAIWVYVGKRIIEDIGVLVPLLGLVQKLGVELFGVCARKSSLCSREIPRPKII